MVFVKTSFTLYGRLTSLSSSSPTVCENFCVENTFSPASGKSFLVFLQIPTPLRSPSVKIKGIKSRVTGK